LGRRRPLAGYALAGVITLVLAAVPLVEGRAWFTASEVPVADTSLGGADLAQWIGAHPETPRPQMVWTNTDDIAFSSYASFGAFHFPGDYIVTRQWTVAGPVLQDAMLSARPDSPASTGDFAFIERYLRMFGVRYLYLSRYIPANQAFIDGRLAGHLKVDTITPSGWIAEVPWSPVQAFAAPRAAVRATTLPNLRFVDAAETKLRETKIDEYNAVAYSEASRPAEMKWNSPVDVSLMVDASPGMMLVVPQNWDTVWTAEANGRQLQLERVGPNFVGTDLDGLSGRTQVRLRHMGYPSWTVAFFLVAAGIACGALGTLIARPRPEVVRIERPND
jgi:hypothetical protein